MLSLLVLLAMAIGAAIIIAKTGLLTFASVALGIFMVLRLTGCSTPPNRPYCETKAVHKARIHLDYEDPDIEGRSVNENGLPIEDPKANIQGPNDDHPHKLVHQQGW